MALIAVVLAGGAAVVGGGGYVLKRLIDRAEDAVEGVADDLKEFVIKKIWPNILPILRILPTLLLMIIISYCDAFLKDGPRPISDLLLANGVYYCCWMCALYFILTVLLCDLLRVKVNLERLVIIVVLTLGVLLPSWQVFGVYFLQFYDYMKPNMTDLVEYLLSFSPFFQK
jgi:hypothetical protein